MKLIENSVEAEKLQSSQEADPGKMTSCEVAQVNGKDEKSLKEKVETKLPNGVKKLDEAKCNGNANGFYEGISEEDYQLVLESSSEDDGSPTKKENEDSKYDVVQEIEDLLGINSNSEEIDKELDGAESIELNDKDEDNLISGESQDEIVQGADDVIQDETTDLQRKEEIKENYTSEAKTNLEEQEKQCDSSSNMDMVVDEVESNASLNDSIVTVIKEQDVDALPLNSDILKVTTSSDENNCKLVNTEMQDSCSTQQLEKVKEDVVEISQDDTEESKILLSQTSNVSETFSDLIVVGSAGASEDETNQSSFHEPDSNILETPNEKDDQAKNKQLNVKEKEKTKKDHNTNGELGSVETEDSENLIPTNLNSEEIKFVEKSKNTEEELNKEECNEATEYKPLYVKDTVETSNEKLAEIDLEEEIDDNKNTTLEKCVESQSKEISVQKENIGKTIIDKSCKLEIDNMIVDELVKSENVNFSTNSCAKISVEGPRKRTVSEGEDITPNKKLKSEEEDNCKLESSTLKRPCLDPIKGETKRLRAADSTLDKPKEEMDSTKPLEVETKADKEESVADNTDLSQKEKSLSLNSMEMQCTEINSASGTIIALDEPMKHSSDEVSTSSQSGEKNYSNHVTSENSVETELSVAKEPASEVEYKGNVEVSSTDMTTVVAKVDKEKEWKSKSRIEQEHNSDKESSNDSDFISSKTLKEASPISISSNVLTDEASSSFEVPQNHAKLGVAKEKNEEEDKLNESTSSSTKEMDHNSFPAKKTVESEQVDSSAISLPSTKFNDNLSLSEIDEKAKLDILLRPPLNQPNSQNSSLSTKVVEKSKLDDSSTSSTSSESMSKSSSKVEAGNITLKSSNTVLAAKSNQPPMAKILPLLKKFRKSELKKLTRTELEEAVVLKICEAITDRSELGQLRLRCQALEQNIELWRKKATQFEKQSRELEMVLKRYLSETAQLKRDGLVKAALPIKVTRSVGLQVVLASSMHGALVSSKSRLSESDQLKHNVQQQQRQPQQQQPQRQQQQPPPRQQTSQQTVTAMTSVDRPRRTEPESQKAHAVKATTFIPPVSSVGATPVRRPVGRPPKHPPLVNPPPPPVKPVSQPSPSKSTPPSTPAKTPTKTPVKIAPSPSKDLEVIDLTDKEEKAKATQSSPTGGGIRVNPSTQLCYVQQSTASSPPQQMAYIVQKPGQRQYLVTTASASPPRVGPSRPPPGLALPVQFRGSGHVIPMQQAPPASVRTNPTPSARPATPNILQRVQPQQTSLKHPAPLPPAPVSVAAQRPGTVMKGSPPKPQLKIAKTVNGIMLSWSMSITKDLADMASYQLYAYQEGTAPPATSLWKKVGDVKALPLPMACTLTQFIEGHKYHFAVRAVDVHGRVGPFSQPSSILLTN